MRFALAAALALSTSLSGAAATLCDKRCARQCIASSEMNACMARCPRPKVSAEDARACRGQCAQKVSECQRSCVQGCP